VNLRVTFVLIVSKKIGHFLYHLDLIHLINRAASGNLPFIIKCVLLKIYTYHVKFMDAKWTPPNSIFDLSFLKHKPLYFMKYKIC